MNQIEPARSPQEEIAPPEIVVQNPIVTAFFKIVKRKAMGDQIDHEYPESEVEPEVEVTVPILSSVYRQILMTDQHFDFQVTPRSPKYTELRKVYALTIKRIKMERLAEMIETILPETPRADNEEQKEETPLFIEEEQKQDLRKQKKAKSSKPPKQKKKSSWANPLSVANNVSVIECPADYSLDRTVEQISERESAMETSHVDSSMMSPLTSQSKSQSQIFEYQEVNTAKAKAQSAMPSKNEVMNVTRSIDETSEEEIFEEIKLCDAIMEVIEYSSITHFEEHSVFIKLTDSIFEVQTSNSISYFEEIEILPITQAFYYKEPCCFEVHRGYYYEQFVQNIGFLSLRSIDHTHDDSRYASSLIQDLNGFPNTMEDEEQKVIEERPVLDAIQSNITEDKYEEMSNLTPHGVDENQYDNSPRQHNLVNNSNFNQVPTQVQIDDNMIMNPNINQQQSHSRSYNSEDIQIPHQDGDSSSGVQITDQLSHNNQSEIQSLQQTTQSFQNERKELQKILLDNYHLQPDFERSSWEELPVEMFIQQLDQRKDLKKVNFDQDASNKVTLREEQNDGSNLFKTGKKWNPINSKILPTIVPEGKELLTLDNQKSDPEISDLHRQSPSNQLLVPDDKKCQCIQQKVETKFEEGPKEKKKEEEEEEIRALSYNDLQRFICLKHPCNPVTKQKFDFNANICVKDYYFKLGDSCGVYKICLLGKYCLKKCRKYQKGEFQEKRERPEHMKHEGQVESASENSDSDEDGAYGGLSAAGCHLGIGAVLYLQILKTFSILFIVLSVINIPIILTYANSSKQNNYTQFEEFFPYFTVGNIGRTDDFCGYKQVKSSTKLDLKCENDGFIESIQLMGLLYKVDMTHESQLASGLRTCSEINKKNSGQTDQARRLEDASATAGTDTSTSSSGTAASTDSSSPSDTSTQSSSTTPTTDSSQASDSSTQGSTTTPKTDSSTATPSDSSNQGSSASSSDSSKTSDSSTAPQTSDASASSTASTQSDSSAQASPSSDSSKASGSTPAINNSSLIETIHTLYNIDALCNQENIFSADNKASLQSQFNKNCKKNKECSLDLDFYTLMKPQCRERMQTVTSDQFVMLVGCRSDYLNFFGKDYHKLVIAWIIVIGDMISICIIMYFIMKLQDFCEEYITIVESNQVTLRDFSVFCRNVKIDKFTQELILIKMKVWLHFNRLLYPHKYYGNNMKVADVTMSITDIPKIKQLLLMQETQDKINLISSKLIAGDYKQALYFEKKEELEDLKETYEIQKDKYQMIIDEERLRQESKVQKMLKSERIYMIDYIFVTFEHSETKHTALDLFKRESKSRKCIRYMFCIKNRKQVEKEFLNQELFVNDSVEPDEIIWENLTFSDNDNKQRRRMLWLVGFLFIIISAILFIAINDEYRINTIMNPPMLCPQTVITQKDAYEDSISNRPKDLLSCFCQQEAKEMIQISLYFLSFTDFVESSGKESDGNGDALCKDYVNQKAYTVFIQILVYLQIVTVNGIISRLFNVLGEYQRKHTNIDSKTKSLTQILLQEVLNTGLIVTFVSFDPSGLVQKLSTQPENVKIDKITYNWFESSWYFDVGKVICIALSMSIFTSNVFEYLAYLKSALMRLKDRSCRSNLKKIPHDEDDDEPNTKRNTQADLERLYEGNEFMVEKSLSRMTSTFIVIIIFSSGMPILYVIGIIFFTLTYLNEKWLLIKFYKRTENKLNKDIPMYTVSLLRYILLAKMIFGIIMFSDPQVFSTVTYPDASSLPLKINMKEWLLNWKSLNEDAKQQIRNDEIDYLNRISEMHQQIYIAFIVIFVLIVAGGKFIIWMIFVTFFALKNLSVKIIQKAKQIALYSFFLIKAYLRKTYRRLRKCIRHCKKKLAKNKTQVGVVAQDEEDDEEKEAEREVDVDSNNANLDQGEIEQTNEQLIGQNHPNIADNMSISDKTSMNNEDVTKQADEEMKKMKEAQQKREAEYKKLNALDYSENIYQELNMINLQSIYSRSLLELDELRLFFNIPPNTEEYKQYRQKMLDTQVLDDDKEPRKSFLEKCYHHAVKDIQVKEFELCLMDRVTKIEEVINHNFNNIKEVIQKEKEEKKERDLIKAQTFEEVVRRYKENEIKKNFEMDEDLKFDNKEIYTFQKKLDQLVLHQDALIQQDKNDVDNIRGNQRICRMQGSLSQTYFIFDSQKNGTARKIYYGLNKEYLKERIQEQEESLRDGLESSDDDLN